MRFTLTPSLLLFSASVIARPRTALGTQDGLHKRGVPFGTRGEYQFLGCDYEKYHQLSTLLDVLWNALGPVIADAKESQGHPSAAYQTFFHDQANAPFVAEVLTNVTRGNAMFAPLEELHNAFDATGSPTFVCTSEDVNLDMVLEDGSHGDAYTKCMGVPEVQSWDEEYQVYVAFFAPPTPLIMLCPRFFSGLRPHPPRDFCPVVTRKGTEFKRNQKYDRKPNVTGQMIWQNQLFTLLEEIVHYYLQTQPQIEQLRPEVRDINGAWRLGAKEALSNAVSYVFYAATFHRKCNSWPTPDDGRELLEVVADSEAADVSDSSTGLPEDVMEIVSAKLRLRG